MKCWLNNIVLETCDGKTVICITKIMKQSVSETLSLWREFVWLDCNSCEEMCLHNLMKSYRTHVRQLSLIMSARPNRSSFTDCLETASSPKISKYVRKMAKMLQYCNNLANTSQFTRFKLTYNDTSDLQLREAIEEMKPLRY